METEVAVDSDAAVAVDVAVAVDADVDADADVVTIRRYVFFPNLLSASLFLRERACLWCEWNMCACCTSHTKHRFSIAYLYTW